MKRILFFSIPFFFICTSLAQQKDKFRPGQLWKDDKGVHINAHGGGMLVHKKTYYWFGEHKVTGEIGTHGASWSTLLFF